MTLDDLDTFDGVGFKAATAEEYIFSALVSVASEISRDKMAVGSAEVHELRSARAKALDTVATHFHNMERTLIERRANLAAYSHLRFVSIGYDCLPRVLLTRWGFKPSAKMGEKSMPFDLAFHSAKGVRHVIETDFDFYNGPSLQYNEEVGHAVFDDLGILLNHETDAAFYADDWRLLRERYARRAEGFREAMARPEKTLFVHRMRYAHLQHDVAQLFRYVRSLRGGKPTAFVCIYTPRFQDKVEDVSFADKDVRLIVRKDPMANYVWHRPRHTFSQRGVNFERDIVDQLKQSIRSLGWEKVTQPA